MALFLTFGSSSISMANVLHKPAPKDIKTVENTLKPTLDPNQKVRVIVELKDAPGVDFAQKQGVRYEDLSPTKQKQLETDAVSEQSQVKSSINTKVKDIKYLNQFTTVVNGFSAEVKAGEIQTLEELPDVKKVTVTHEYERPKVQPEMKYSKELVQAQDAWKNYKYKGEKMLVGIIDTGIDSSHQDMILKGDHDVKLTKETVETKIAENKLPGKYFTNKVPYGYNYMDHNDNILDEGPDASMHGMHVSGTVAANGDEDNGGVVGIAPEAQLLALKVFGNDPLMPSTFGDVYIKAIDDAIKLGVDVVNMSLGSTAGYVDQNDPEQVAVKRAVDNGVMMSISAGNSAYFANGYYYPMASNPDYGVSGAPGLSYDALQVASYENSNIQVDALQYSIDGAAGGKAAFLSAGSLSPSDLVKTNYDVVKAGIGAPEDFEGKDFTGKVALIRRGTLGFVDKALNAQAAGAAGVIIYNNQDGIVNMASDPAIKIPQLFMLKNDGDVLAASLDSDKKVTIDFKGDKETIANPSAGKMSDFSSWGLTPNLDFKPEITAPGGQIMSTFNNNQYGIMSGTSMAAPHVSGGSALILERVVNDFKLTGAARVLLAKNLLMNTAKTVEASPGVYVSPRRQGSGLMQLNNALQTPVVLTNSATGEAKVALKEIQENKATFTLKAHNYSDAPVTYNVTANAQTDPYDEGFIHPNTEDPQALEGVVTTDQSTITVPAGGEAID